MDGLPPGRRRTHAQGILVHRAEPPDTQVPWKRSERKQRKPVRPPALPTSDAHPGILSTSDEREMAPASSEGRSGDLH